jgi:hypothetical protein
MQPDSVEARGPEFADARDAAEAQAAERVCALARRGDWPAVHDEARRQHAIHLQRALAGRGRHAWDVLKVGAHRLAKAARLTSRGPQKLPLADI